DIVFRPAVSESVEDKFDGYTRSFYGRFSNQHLRIGYDAVFPVHMDIIGQLELVVINSASGVASDLADFVEHTHTVADDVDLAAVIVVPADGNFTKPQSVTLCDKEKFNVKSEPVDLHFIEQRPERVHSERLEPALRVPKGKPGHKTHYQVEDL